MTLLKALVTAPAVAPTPVAARATVVLATPAAAILCNDANVLPATTFPMPAWIPAAKDPPMTP